MAAFALIFSSGLNVACYAEAVVVNADFEQGREGWLSAWNGYQIEEADEEAGENGGVVRSGKRSLKFSCDGEPRHPGRPYRAYQRVELGQEEPASFTVGVWGKTEDLVMLKEDRRRDDGSWARLRLFIHFQDGTTQYNPVGRNNNIYNFDEDHTEWTYMERTFVYDRPVKAIDFHFQMNNVTGTVWFDDIYFEMSAAG